MAVAFSDLEAHEQHRLADGTLVTLRPIRPSDAPELAQRFRELSPEARRQRFLGGVPSLDDHLLHYLTEVDGWNHVALVATVEDAAGQPRGVGVARFIRSATDPTLAEPAITVCDADQGRGVGTLLARALGQAARDRGVLRFRGPILTDNAQVRRLLRDYAAELRDSEDGPIFEIELPEEAGSFDPAPSASQWGRRKHGASTGER